MANDIGPKIGIQGEAEFRREIAQINTSLKTMGAEMGKVTSAYIGNENSLEALESKNAVLSKQMDELSKKADLQRARLKELDEQGVDPTSASYQKLQQDLYKTETQLNKTDAELKSNTEKMDNLGKETDDTAESMDKGAAKAATFGDVLKANLLSEAIIGGVKALADGMKKLGGAILDAAAAADDLNTLSVQTGISTDELQKFQYAAATIDVSVDTLTGSMTKLTRNMASAASGSGAAAEAFAALGIEVTDSNGEFRDRNEIFNETIKALGKVTNETERDALAMNIFGKSAQELNPLILGGADALAELGDHAEEAGLILSGDALEALASVADRFDVLKQTVGALGNQFLAQFAGPITGAIDKVIGYAERLVAAFKEGGVSELAETVSGIATEVASTLNSYLPQIVSFGTELTLKLVEGIISMMPDIINSGITIVTTLVQSLAEALPELIPAAVDAVLTIVDTLTDPENLGMLVDAAIAITIALANGLIQALPRLIEKAPEIVMNLVEALIANAPKLLDAAWELIATIGTGVAQAARSLWDVGKNIVTGIWDGISQQVEWFREKISGFFGGIVNGVKSALGIASPSKVFAGIGENMALGLGVGFDSTIDKVERDMMSTIPVPSLNVGTVTASGAAGMMGGGVVEEITIPVTVGGAELARVLYRHIVGEGQRIGPAAIA